MQFLNAMSKPTTKAETLSFLTGRLEQSRIAPLVYFTLQDWKEHRLDHIKRVQSAFKNGMVIVRSSAVGEDSRESSMAGRFCSLLDIDCANAQELATAIDTVFQSYTDGNDRHQVLIQPMIANVILSGVAFTQDQKTGAPYIVISYDDETAKTDTITSGGFVSKSLRIWRGTSPDSLTSKRMRKVYYSIKELESVMGSSTLDIEFAVDDHYRVWTLQVRPLILERELPPHNIARLERTLDSIRQDVLHISKPHDDLYGARTLLGDMSDWNPAEMIGINPFPLAYSLYHRLITADIWHQARSGMGYRRMDGHHLMEQLGGHPFIDTRKSFNSFLPAGIEPLTAERLLNAWLLRLSTNPVLYDKVEFDIVSTCYTPGFDMFFTEHYSQVLTDTQYEIYKTQLRDLTNNCVTGNIDHHIDWCEAEAKKLKTIQSGTDLMQLTSGTPQDISRNIENLIQQCRDMGTKPFSAAARHAFIGEAILRSCNKMGAISDDTVTALKLSFSTISNAIIDGMAKITRDRQAKEKFFSDFGHIRPSSYDILSQRYDTMDNIGAIAIAIPQTHHHADFDIKALQVSLDGFFQQQGYSFNTAQFVAYYIKSVQMREWIKLIFTRNLSDVIECVAAIGHAYGFDRKTISFCPIDSLITAVNSPSPRETLADIIEKQKQRRNEHKAVYMNYLLEDAKDIYVIPVQRSTPNFITYKRITAPSVTLVENEPARADLAGKIICIERADPGFDWLFGCGIAGLITKYGGANSHMAIRCSEFSLPAAIGCGELIYSKLQNAGQIEMDCQTGKVVAL